MKRAQFIKLSLWGGISLQIPLFFSCENEPYLPLTKNQAEILKKILLILFPVDNYGPSANDFSAFEFIVQILNDAFYDPEQKNFLLKGFDSLENDCLSKINKNFLECTDIERDNLIKVLSKENNSIKNWLSFLISLIIEALLSDPIYGGNTNAMAYLWLEHKPGLPPANNLLKYPEILIRKIENP
jgi:gluconate 2-dehydrogenase gamma chain